MKYVAVFDPASSTTPPPINELDLLTGMIFSSPPSVRKYLDKISNCPSVTSFKRSINNDNEFRVVVCGKYDAVLWIVKQRDDQLRYDVTTVSRSREVTRRFLSPEAAMDDIGTLCTDAAGVSAGPWWSLSGDTLCRMDIVFTRRSQSRVIATKKVPYKDTMAVIAECYFGRWHKVRRPHILSSRTSYWIMAFFVQAILCTLVRGAVGAGVVMGDILTYIAILGICSVAGDFIESLARKIIYRREPPVLTDGYGYNGK